MNECWRQTGCEKVYFDIALQYCISQNNNKKKTDKEKTHTKKEGKQKDIGSSQTPENETLPGSDSPHTSYLNAILISTDATQETEMSANESITNNRTRHYLQRHSPLTYFNTNENDACQIVKHKMFIMKCFFFMNISFVKEKCLVSHMNKTFTKQKSNKN